MNRREFIGGAAGVLSAASLLVGDEQAKPVAPSDRVNLAIIGAGSRGQQLMRTFLRVPGVRFAGICDVYEPRFAAARKITGEQTPTYADYRRLLEAREIDAVYIATPLSDHAEHVTAALESGRPVYGEKSLGLTVEDCNRIVEAVRRSGRVFQIGLQYHYAPWYREAITRIHAGKIGQVTQIYAYWHRNNNWRRPVPEATVVEHGIVTGASYRAELPYRGPGEPIRVPEGTAGNPDFLACKAFINSVRTKQRPLADEQKGWGEGVAVALDNKAIDEGRRILFAEHAQMPPAAQAGGA